MRDNIQGLLKPRYKVIADYPGNNLYAVGSIIEDTGWGIELFPHLFRRLEWWEDRDVKDMPEYVRFGDWDKAHTVYKIKEYNPTGFGSYPMCAMADGKTVKDYFLPHFNNAFPATETDYLNQTPKPKI